MCLGKRVARTGAGRARRNPWCAPRRPLGARRGRQRDPELPARADVELLEDVPQVPLDCARTEEELRTDLGIRVPVRANAAICASCAVSWSRASSVRSGCRARRKQLAGRAAGEASAPIRPKNSYAVSSWIARRRAGWPVEAIRRTAVARARGTSASTCRPARRAPRGTRPPPRRRRERGARHRASRPLAKRRVLRTSRSARRSKASDCDTGLSELLAAASISSGNAHAETPRSSDSTARRRGGSVPPCTLHEAVMEDRARVLAEWSGFTPSPRSTGKSFEASS